MEQEESEGASMKPAKEATAEETLAEIEADEPQQSDATDNDNVVSPDGAFDEDKDLKDADPK